MYQPRTLSLRELLLAAAVLALPFLDWPWLPGDAFVRPLALYPLSLGFFLCIAQLRAMPRSRPFLTFSFFVVVSLLITTLSVLVVAAGGGREEIQGTIRGDAALRGAISLLTAWGTYLVFVTSLTSERAASRACRLAIASGFISTGVAIVQAGSIYFGFEWARVMGDALCALNERGALSHGKAFGLTPEGSLLADYLLVIPIPLALAALSARYSVFTQGKVRWVEPLLLILSVVALAFSRSRVGLVALAALVIFVVFLGPRHGGRLTRAKTKTVATLLAILIPLAVFGWTPLLGIIATLGSATTLMDGGIISNATRLGNMTAALSMFVRFPLGVGLGGYPFYYADHVPSWAVWSPEVQMYLGMKTSVDFNELSLPNAKALLPRILSETGLVGGSIFLYFFASLFQRVSALARKDLDPATTYLAHSVLYSLVAMIPMSFNIDSFVLPHYFFIFSLGGLVLTAERQSRKLERRVT